MTIAYLTVKRALALRLAQIKGTSSSTLETYYAGAWASMLDGAEIPKTAFKDQILGIERELVQYVGNNPQHPARSQLYGRSATLTDLSSTPTQDRNGASFFGVFDSCADAVNDKPLTWVPTQTITDIIDNGSTFFSDTPFYYYNINGNFVRCTRPSIFLQGVSWDYDTQSTAYDNDGDSPLPEGLYSVWIDGVTARAAQVGWVDAAQVMPMYDKEYQDGLVRFNLVGEGQNIPLTARTNPIAG